MFYPNSVLISRTPGIATIWLMATLGAKQNSRKISKQAVLQIDIPESCQAVQHPDVPMALRLQSNLLYGISRVYSQQCLFVLAEAEMAHNTLKNLMKHTRGSELDPKAGRVRPELLIVPDDPAFLLGFDFPVVDFDSSATFDSSGVSFMLDGDASGISLLSSQSNKSLHNPITPQLDIPSSASLFGEPSLPLGSARSLPRYRMSAELEEPEFLYEADFEFDITGNIIDRDMLDMGSPRARQSDNLATSAQGNATVDTQVQDEMLGVNAEQTDAADEAQFFHNDNVLDTFLHGEADLNRDLAGEADHEEHANSATISGYIEAPQIRRQKTQPRELPRDTTIQIPNSDLLNWNRNYIANMEMFRRAKRSRQQVRHAKGYAAFVLCSLGQSINLDLEQKAAAPLHDLAIRLAEQLTGMAIGGVPIKKNNKRRLSSAEISSSDSETRRSRLRVHEIKETPYEAMVEAQGDVIGMLDDLDPSIELAREAVAAMEDQSTQLALPWSGSRAGSFHSGHRSRQGSVHSSRAAGNTSIGHATSLRSFDRRTSRLRSASPLFGQRSVLNTPAGFSPGFGSQNNDFLFDVGSGPGTSPQNPGLDISDAHLPDAMARSSMHSLTMTQESADFLAWIENALDTKTRDIEAGQEASLTVTFDELLPIKDHNRAVAAQGFLHLLALASRGAIEVSQVVKDDHGNDMWWGSISMSAARLP